MHKDKQHFTIHGEMGYWRSLNQAILGTCIARAPSVPQANAFILLTNFSVRGVVLSLKTFETFCCPQFFVSALTCLFNQCLNSSKWLQSEYSDGEMPRQQTWWDHLNVSGADAICIILTCNKSSSISLEIGWAGPSFTGLIASSWATSQHVKMPTK